MSKRETNVLDRKKLLALAKALDAAELEFSKEKPTLKKAASMMSNTCGFKVTPSNLESLILDGIIKDFRPGQLGGRPSTGKMKEVTDRITSLEKQLEAIARRLGRIEVELAVPTVTELAKEQPSLSLVREGSK